MRDWPQPAPETLKHLSATIAPLMRLAPLASLDELQFQVWCERLAVAWLQGDEEAQLGARERIQQALASLPDSIPAVHETAERRAWVASEGFWDHLDRARIDRLQATFAPLMRYRTRTPTHTVEINLPDSIQRRSWIIYGPAGEGAFAESYREQVEALVRRLAGKLPELAKLRRGQDLTSDELDVIGQTLNQADLFVTEETLRKAFEAPGASLADFLRHILCQGVKLPNREERINAAFEAFIREHGTLRANQLNFLRAVKAAVLSHARITRASLDEPPLSRVGRVEILFPQEDIDELIQLAGRFEDEAA